MRVAIIAPSPYSEVAARVAARLAERGTPPCGVVTLPAVHAASVLRKSTQLGPGPFIRYAVRRVLGRSASVTPAATVPTAPHLTKLAARHGIPLRRVRDINGAEAVDRLRAWGAEAAVYTGGGIVRRGLLDALPRGVLNAHLGLLPEIRGMSAPEWSLLRGVPLGVTVHLMDPGIDTGPVVCERRLPPPIPGSLQEARARLVDIGVEALLEALDGLSSGALLPLPQERRDVDLQHFVMHETLRSLAEARLLRMRAGPTAGDPSAPVS
jgi:methionyl-tRNA formyltransferase